MVCGAKNAMPPCPMIHKTTRTYPYKTYFSEYTKGLPYIGNIQSTKPNTVYSFTLTENPY
jgi:hypothetical protein